MPNRHRQVRLGRQHESWVYACVCALLLTGWLWLLFHFFVSAKTDFGEGHHPLEAWWLKLHGFASMGALVLFGSLIPVHMRNAWQRARNRSTGSALVLLMIALSLSGYGLYYAGGEEVRPWISTFHWIAGSCLGLCIPIHVMRGRRALGKATRLPAHVVPHAEPNALRVIHGTRDK